jgi:hypothetical protein
MEIESENENEDKMFVSGKLNCLPHDLIPYF